MVVSAGLPIYSQQNESTLDPEARTWVMNTLSTMSVDQQIGQLIMPSLLSTYTGSDTETFDSLVALAHDQEVGGFIAVSYTHLTLPTNREV